MLIPDRNYPHLSYEVISSIARIVDAQLIDGWAVRIEYTDKVQYLKTDWHQWGGVHYKYDNSASVMDCIFSCHVNNPMCAIRLHAEKFSPSTNLYYSVCQACDYTEVAGEMLQEAANDDV